MKIRAITYFLDLDPHHPEGALNRAGAFLEQAATAYQDAGIAVQSKRAATQPFPRMGVTARAMPALARTLRKIGDSQAIAYLALGPVAAGDDPAFLDVLPDVFAAASGVFASVDLTSRKRIDLGLLRRCANLIQHVSRVTSDGLTNLYLCASANVQAGAPFFPAAYHGGGDDRFALAIESADLAIDAANQADSPDAFVHRLAQNIQKAAEPLMEVTDAIVQKHRIHFGGLDFSLAPYPGQETSLAGAMERLGAVAGGGGMVAAAALVMSALETAQFPRCGFSGLMLPVLEDTALGARAAENALTTNDLLLYSAICGTGLDCIPLPGDVSEAALAALLLDTAALALRLNKPLTARLMPIPGKQPGDPVAFPHFEYFVPARVMRPPLGHLSGVLGGNADFGLLSRQSRHASG